MWWTGLEPWNCEPLFVNWTSGRWWLLSSLNTAFALPESEQGLQISSLSSCLNTLTTALPKGHHQVLRKESLWLWLWLSWIWVLRESRLKTNPYSRFHSGFWLPQKAFSSTTLKYLAFYLHYITVKPKYHFELKKQRIKINVLKGSVKVLTVESPFTELSLQR